MSADNATYVGVFTTVNNKPVYHIEVGGASYMGDITFSLYEENEGYYSLEKAKEEIRHFFRNAERVVGSREEVTRIAYEIDRSMGYTEYGVCFYSFDFPFDPNDEETIEILNDPETVKAIYEGMEDIHAGRLTDLDFVNASPGVIQTAANVIQTQRDMHMGEHTD